MTAISPKHGIGTIATHAAQGENQHHAHVTPIYQTSTFCFPDVKTGSAIFKGEKEGYVYSRVGNPNASQAAQKIAILEGIDLLRSDSGGPVEEVVAGRLFSSGMAAISTAILARVRAGETIIAQQCLYGNSFTFLYDLAPRLGINVVWLNCGDVENWQAAFEAHPEAVLAYTETPANPTMEIINLREVVEIAHAHEAWVMMDNTFATPYCQRPLTLGCDVVLHSTTKYLSGHGLIIGGAVVSTHLDYMHKGGDQIGIVSKVLGASPSPFDAWLLDIGLKTFELRMQRHCENGMQIARWLSDHPKVGVVHYPGLEEHPGHEVAQSQMFNGFGSMISFELKDGFEAGASLMDRVGLATLAVSLGNVDTLIQHPASMTHASVPREEREKMGVSDGLVRLSVGIENVEDLIADLDQALA